MKRFLVLALTLPLFLGCAGSFPTALPPGSGGATPTPTPSSAPTPTPRPGVGGTLDLSNGAPIGTLYFSTNYGRTASEYKYQIYAMRSDGSGRVLIAESNAGTGATGLFFTGMSPDGKYIAYTTSGVAAASQNAFLTKADGSGKRALVTGGYAFQLAFSQDSQRVVYSLQSSTGSSQDVVAEGIDGSNRRVVTTGSFATSTLGVFGVSPDGTKLVASGDSGIFVENIVGTGRVTLAGTEFLVLGNPYFSPDGTKVAVYLQHKTDTARRGIYLLNADGSTNLSTTSPAFPESNFGLRDNGGRTHGDMSNLEGWTPSGLLYSVGRRNNGVTVVVEYEWFITNPDGSGQRSVAKWAPTAFDNIGDIGRGVLSPDKAWLIYSSRNLFRVALAGGAPQQLTDTPTGSNFKPLFNSDGTKITFLSSRDDRGSIPGGEGGGGRGTLYIMDANGANQTRLIDGFSTDRPEALRTKIIGGQAR